MPTQNNPDSSHLERHLADAQTRAEKGEYAAAVAAVRQAKNLAPKNVYVLAFEKQAEQLSELDSAKSLTEEQRTDILESIPAIIERALESSRSPGMTTDMTALRAGGDALQDKKEKAAALEWLKDQYFQHAHEYIRKGEYQNALAEIRRVYIIDPTNSIASDFEKQFEALAQLKRKDTLRVYPSPASRPPLPSRAPVAEASPAPSEEENAEPTPMMTEEWSSPRQQRRGPPPAPRTQEVRKGRKKGSVFLILLIVLSLAVLAAILYIYYQRTIYKKAQVTTLTASTAEQFIGVPSEAAEQSFVVSNDDASSGTPQVTALASNDVPRIEPPNKSAASSRGKQADTRKERPAAPLPAKEEKPESAPTLMATQAQPDQRQPALQPKPEDTASPPAFVPVEKQARIIRLEKPRITASGFLVGIEGQVVVQVRIDQTGKPIQTVTLKSTNDLLIQPVIDAVMSSQFAPAEMTTGPVASWLTIPFRFASK